MGSIPTLQRPFGMLGYLYRRGVLLKDFAAWSRELTERVRGHGHSMAAAAGRTVRYLQSNTERKEAVVRAVIEREGIKEGLAGVWSAVEPCRTFFLRKDRQKKHLVLESGFGKCLHHYFYFVHQVFGLLHLRLQTWFPFTVTVGLNGHEWMARQMDAAGLGYRRAVPLEERTGEVADTIFRPVVREGRRYRALNPWGRPGRQTAGGDQ